MSQSVRAVERALDILLCFTREEPTRSLTQIAESIHMSKTTVHRLLATLENKRFITRDKTTGLYRLGFRFIEMASLVLQDVDLHRWAQPYLQRLSAEYGETVDLSILDGSHVIYLEVIESPQRVKLAAAVGQRLPALYTASGKALLAYLPEDQAKKIIAENLSEASKQTPPRFRKYWRICAQPPNAAMRSRNRSMRRPSTPLPRRFSARTDIRSPRSPSSARRSGSPGTVSRRSENRSAQMTQMISSEIGLVALSAIVTKTHTR